MVEGEMKMEDEGFELMAVEELVRRIHGGSVRVEELPVEVRQRCVGHLTMEGFTIGEIMSLMGMGERMVQRDRAVIRREEAVGPGVGLGDELMGEFGKMVMGSVGRLVRLARDGETPAYARLWAEEAIVRSYQRYVETARRMNYVEDGKRRIMEQRQRDEEPARRAWRERQELGAKLVMERLRRMAGIEGEGNGETWTELLAMWEKKRGLKVEEYEQEEEE